MPAPDDVFALVVAAFALSYAYPVAIELFVGWYSGVDRQHQLSGMQCSMFGVSVGVAAAAIASLL